MGLGDACVPSRSDDSPPRAAGIGRRLRAPIVRDDLRFGFPFLSWDAWMLLHHLHREPLARNRDGSIPVRWLKPLERRLVPLPDWAGFDTTATGRVERAALLLRDMGLVDPRKGPAPETPNLRISSRGIDSLRLGRVAFFAGTLDCARIDIEDSGPDLLGRSARENLRIACWRMGREIEEFEGPGRRLGERLLGVLPLTGSVKMSDMEAAFAPSDPHVFVRGVPKAQRRVEVSSEGFLERIDVAMSRILMVDALALPYSLGLVARGITAEGDITWGFTGAGREWFGAPPDTHPAPPRHVKVTPAFDIFFGRVDPAALAELSIYAELSGQDHGVVGTLSRQGIHSASAMGVAIREVVASLEGIVASPVPPNVLVALDDWARSAQPVKVREGVVLQCPDKLTAEALERLGQGTVERLSDTVLLLPDRRALAELRRRVGETGLML